jgi:hypothetical protein
VWGGMLCSAGADAKASLARSPAAGARRRRELAGTFSQEMASELEGVKEGLAHMDARLRSNRNKPPPQQPRKGGQANRMKAKQ